MINSYISIDLETTGLNPKLDKIIEIGAVKVVDGVKVDTFSTFVNPGRQLEARIITLTGITQEQVDEAPELAEVFPKLIEFLGELPLLGHRILFDYSFLKKTAVNQKLTFEKQGIDTLRIARVFLPQLEHRTLEYLCKYYEIPHTAHRAIGDAEATDRLYQILATQFYEQDSKIFAPQQLNYSVKRETPATKAQKERLNRLIEQYNVTIDYDIEKLTRSEASRYADKILAKYGRQSR
ncbi:MAG: 3'-5' exonuclease [Lachnospiraceae bacterium]|nr:3'-5' exonuclease [Lachnospiraceae bacterium]